MTVSVSYACPHCSAITDVERAPELADKSVTTRPQAGWEYANPDDPALESADGIAFTCGVDRPTRSPTGEDADGCGRPFYLNFLRYSHGVELEPDPPTYGGPRFDFNP